MRATARGWVSRSPWLLQTVCRVMGKPYSEIAVLRKIVRPGDVVFDIGANTGQYLCLFCHLVGPTGTVHAFEPVPPTFGKLQRHVARHARGYRIFLNQCALGEDGGIAKMYVPRGDFTEAALIPHSDASWKLQGEPNPSMDVYDRCLVTTLDAYVAEHQVPQIALIKCDVEGAELFVLKGAKSVLRSPSPPILLLEVWSSWTVDFGYRPQDLFSFLREEAGYYFFHVGRRELRLVNIHEDPVPGEFPDFLNYLCVVPSVHRERLSSLPFARTANLSKK